MRLGLIKSTGTDPYKNLALERYLLETVAKDQVILYLWQNKHTVVIGRNQSALSECRIQKLKSDGGLLARRLSGGGSVYHDLGNLNFTFLAPTDLFDEALQTSVILYALKLLGIQAEKTGRNDLLVEGKKFSGHAYYHTRNHSYHHGTLLIHADLENMATYLNPSPLKLKAKGVASVKSRVGNLADVLPGLSVEAVARALQEAFFAVYAGKAELALNHGHESFALGSDQDTVTTKTPSLSFEEDTFTSGNDTSTSKHSNLAFEEISLESLGDKARKQIESYQEEFASRKWILKGENPCQYSLENRFEWGCVRVDWDEENNLFRRIALYSDGLDADFLEAIPHALERCEISLSSITEALKPLIKDTSSSSQEQKELYVKDLANLITSRR